MQKRQTFMRAVMRCRCAWNNHVKQITLEEGIPDSYRTVILFLRRNPGARQCSIADFAGVTTSAVNQVVKSMVEEDYVRKEADPSDKRNAKLFLTEAGTQIAEKLHEKIEASDAAITERIGAEKEAELIAFLDQLTDYIRKDLDGC